MLLRGTAKIIYTHTNQTHTDLFSIHLFPPQHSFSCNSSSTSGASRCLIYFK